MAANLNDLSDHAHSKFAPKNLCTKFSLKLIQAFAVMATHERNSFVMRNKEIPLNVEMNTSDCGNDFN